MSEGIAVRNFDPGKRACATDININEFSGRPVSQKVKALIGKKIGSKWKQLGRVLSLSEYTIEQIESDHQGTENKAAATITEWQKLCGGYNNDADADHDHYRGRASLAVVLQALHELDLNDVVLEIITLERKSEKPLFKDVGSSRTHTSRNDLLRNPFTPPLERKHLREIQMDLKKCYLATKMTALPWTEIADMDLWKEYVQPEIIWRSIKAKDGNDIPDQPIKLQDIFTRGGFSWWWNHGDPFTRHVQRPYGYGKSHSDPFTIYVEGPPGYGKSTLGLKLCVDWATDEKYIRKFDLVLHIALQRWDGCVEDMILKSANIKGNHDKQNFWDLFTDHSKNILVVLDGLDVLPQEQEKYAVPFLTREKYSHVSMIVFSRPREARLAADVVEPSWKVKMEEALWEKRLFLAGLEESAQNEFLRKFSLKLGPEKAYIITNTIHHYLEHTPILKQLFRSSLLFQIVLTLASESEKAVDNIIMTETELFKGIFNHFVHRYFYNRDLSIQNFDLFDPENQTRDEILLMKQFGYVALNILLSDKSSFTKEEILQYAHNDERVLELDVLQFVTATNKYEPIHMSFIYFATAYYFWIVWQQNNVAEQSKCWDEKHTRFFASLTRYLFSDSCPLFSFLVGLLGEDVSKVLEVLKKHATDYPTAFYCFAEGLLQTEMTQPLLSSLDAFIPCELVIGNNSFYSSQQFSEVLHYATTTGITKKISWNLGYSVTFGENEVKIDTLKLRMSDEFGALPYTKFTCRELHCYFFQSWFEIDSKRSCEDTFSNMAGDLWPTVLNVIQTCTFETISFDFDSGGMALWFSKICDEITKDELKDVNVKWIKCTFRNGHQSMVPKVQKVIEVKRMKNIEIRSNCYSCTNEDKYMVFLIFVLSYIFISPAMHAINLMYMSQIASSVLASLFAGLTATLIVKQHITTERTFESMPAPVHAGLFIFIFILFHFEVPSYTGFLIGFSFLVVIFALDYKLVCMTGYIPEGTLLNPEDLALNIYCFIASFCVFFYHSCSRLTFSQFFDVLDVYLTPADIIFYCIIEIAAVIICAFGLWFLTNVTEFISGWNGCWAEKTYCKHELMHLIYLKSACALFCIRALYLHFHDIFDFSLSNFYTSLVLALCLLCWITSLLTRESAVSTVVRQPLTRSEIKVLEKSAQKLNTTITFHTIPIQQQMK